MYSIHDIPLQINTITHKANILLRKGFNFTCSTIIIMNQTEKERQRLLMRGAKKWKERKKKRKNRKSNALHFHLTVGNLCERQPIWPHLDLYLSLNMPSMTTWGHAVRCENIKQNSPGYRSVFLIRRQDKVSRSLLICQHNIFLAVPFLEIEMTFSAGF